MNLLKFVNRRLQTRLLVAFLLATLLPSLGIMLLGYFQVNQSFRTQTRESMERTNAMLLRDLSRTLTQLQGDIRHLSGDEALAKLLELEAAAIPRASETVPLQSQISEHFRSLVMERGVYHSITLLDQRGQEVIRVDNREGVAQVVPPAELQSQSEQSTLREAMKHTPGNVYVSEMHLNREWGQVEVPFVPVLQFAVPIVSAADDAGGDVLGLVVSTAYAETLFEPVREAGDLMYLINRDGTFLYHPDAGQTFGGDLGTNYNARSEFSWELQQLVNPAQMQVTGQAPGFERLAVANRYAYAPDQPDRYWVLLNVVPSASLLGDLGRLLGQLWLWLGVGVLVALILALWIAYDIRRPVLALTDAATRFAGGNYGVQVSASREDELGALVQSFNQMGGTVQNVLTTLEQEVQTRTRAIEVGATISRELTGVLKVDALFRTVVSLLMQAFDLYHVQIFLNDPDKGELVLAEAQGQAGGLLKDVPLTRQVRRGIVGRVARTGQYVLLNEARSAPEFEPHPLLPDTQAELAIPLRQGQVVLGVLDIHSAHPQAFQDRDLVLFQSVADQVVVALNNARLFEQTDQAVAEARRLNQQLTRDAWQDISMATTSSGYTYAGYGAPSPAAEDDWLPVMAQAVQTQAFLHSDPGTNGSGEKAARRQLALPLTLRGEVIGVVGVESRSDQPWTQEQESMLQALGNQISLALEAARLTRETQRRAAREAVIAQLTQEVWASNTIDDVLQNAVQQLGQRLDADRVVLQLTAHETAVDPAAVAEEDIHV